MKHAKQQPTRSSHRECDAPGKEVMKALKKEGIERVGKSYIRAERYGRRMKAALKKAAAKNRRAAGKAAAKEE